MKNWNICGFEAAPGEKKQITIEPDVTGYEIPATMICGRSEGKTIVITAGIHSGEYPGVAAAIRAANAIDPQQVSGRILIMHAVNTSGFWAKSPGYIPEDHVNLNADYPGKPDGSPGERIADYFVRQIFPVTDFLIDLHSGGQMEPLTSCLFFPDQAGDEVRQISLEAAMATDIPYLIASAAATGEYSYAARNFGIPGLLLERGFCGCCREEWIQGYYRDIFLLLKHLGTYQGTLDEQICDKKIYGKTIYLTSDTKGLWYPAVEEGKAVTGGALLGRLEDFYGNLLKEYHAKEDGRVFYYTAGLAVNPGDPLVAYGLESSVEGVKADGCR